MMLETLACVRGPGTAGQAGFRDAGSPRTGGEPSLWASRQMRAAEKHTSSMDCCEDGELMRSTGGTPPATTDAIITTTRCGTRSKAASHFSSAAPILGRGEGGGKAGRRKRIRGRESEGPP